MSDALERGREITCDRKLVAEHTRLEQVQCGFGISDGEQGKCWVVPAAPVLVGVIRLFFLQESGVAQK